MVRKASEPAAPEVLVLSSAIVSRLDVARLGRELDILGNALEQGELRTQETGQDAQAGNLRISETLADMLRLNKLNAVDEADRRRLATFLAELKKQAPVLHMSFAAEPPPTFVQKIIGWLRSEIHPLVLLEIGLQPSIAAGCVIRTTNKYFDYSMGQHLRRNRGQLVKLLHEGNTKVSTPAAPQGAT